MKDESSLSVAAVAGVMSVGGVIAAMAVDQAFAASQILDPVMVGREAAIIHLVLRGAIKNAALCGCLLLAFWRCWRGLQLVDLAMQCELTLILYAFANWIQRKVESVRSAAIQIAFSALAICLFGGLASPAPD